MSKRHNKYTISTIDVFFKLHINILMLRISPASILFTETHCPPHPLFFFTSKLQQYFGFWFDGLSGPQGYAVDPDGGQPLFTLFFSHDFLYQTHPELNYGPWEF